MLLRLTGGRVVDPAHGEDGVRRDIWIGDGVVVADPGPGARPDEVVDLAGGVVMAGGVDLHSHIAGGKVNLARLLLPEDHRDHPEAWPEVGARGSGRATPTADAIGCRYAEMGYTAVFEPAMVGANARHTHLEMADIPLLDTGAYLVLGNDDLLLRLMAEGAGQGAVNDYVAWMLAATQSLAIKSVNPGGINAFKFNQRKLDLDEAGPHYGLTPRAVLTTLARAVQELGVPHPLHLHGCNLGVPGNDATTLATIAGMDGLPLHLTHLQFHSYGAEGDRRFSSGAARIAEAVNANPSITVDVGQIMFGQTVTASADTMAQFGTAAHASPAKWIGMDIECDAGCGVVPFRYRDRSFVNGLQWAIGLELFLLIADPWRVTLTTDHPNGAPFTTYPHLIRLLMDRNFRAEQLARLPAAVAAHTQLGSIAREYSLHDIAIVTRAAPARVLGLADRGHLGVGAVGDVVVYEEAADKEAMFRRPVGVYKAGRLIVRDGRVVDRAPGATHVVRPGYDAAIESVVARHFEAAIGLKAKHYRVADDEITETGRGLVVHPCRPAAGPLRP